MKKNLSNKSKAMLWILGAILSIVLMVAVHAGHSTYPNLAAFFVVGCILSTIACVIQALQEFDIYSLKI